MQNQPVREPVRRKIGESSKSDFIGGPAWTRTRNQTVMSGGVVRLTEGERLYNQKIAPRL